MCAGRLIYSHFCYQQIKNTNFFLRRNLNFYHFQSSSAYAGCGKAAIYKQNRRRDINICPRKRARRMPVALKYNTIFQFCCTIWETGISAPGIADSFFISPRVVAVSAEALQSAVCFWYERNSRISASNSISNSCHSLSLSELIVRI